MGKLSRLLGILINLFTGRNERHNHALSEIRDLSKALEKFLVKYSLQEKSSDPRLIFENTGQAKIDVTTIAYRTRTKTKIARDIKSKALPPLLEAVHSDLELLKRALLNPTLGKTAVRDTVFKLHNSSHQLINEVSNIDYK